MRNAIIAGLLTAAAFGASAAAPVLAQPSASNCFFVTQWDGGWRAPDDHTIFLRVSGSKIFRLDLASSCPTLRYPGATLITRNQNSTICSAIDWNLRVRDSGGAAIPCIVGKMTMLTPAQAAALPSDARP
jgi:Family of unknown function (DUF6491)